MAEIDDSQLLQKLFDTILNYNDNQLGLPLKDLFINREIEFDYTVESLKILYSNLDIPQPTGFQTT